MRRYFSRLGDLISRPIWVWLLSRLKMGTATIRLPGGKSIRRAAEQPGPSAELTLHRPGRTMRRLITGGGVGFAESYLAGEWDTDDLATTLEMAGSNLDVYVRKARPGRIIERVRHLWQRITSRHQAAIESIDRHYNLGNSFYEKWLDESMSRILSQSRA